MEELIEMLRYRRPHKSRTENRFINRFIRPLKVETDSVGNLYKVIGDNPTIMWSAHTDSVHRDEGKQNLNVDLDTLFVELSKSERKSNCLGADDAAGCWLLTEMIKAGVPGLYIFHRGEECGGIGSTFIAKECKLVLEGIEAAIAFDRRGTKSVITHQGWSRCCSDEFATSLAAVLGLKHQLDSNGIFTDTANYTHLIPECTNVSVGYYNEHTSTECLDLEYISELRDALLKADWSKLVISRDPTKDDDDLWSDNWRYGNYRYTQKNYGYTRKNYRDVTEYHATPVVARCLQDIIEDHPAYVADYLETVLGVSKEDLEDYIYQVQYGNYWEDKDDDLVRRFKAM